MTRGSWEVEYTNEFALWWYSLDASAQDAIHAAVGLLAEEGTALRYPWTSGVVTSKHGRMRELRVQSRGRPIRIFHAFDPRRSVILLVGGDKTGDRRFYDEMVPLADRLYDEHLTELRDEGLI
jgi:hypothetical protein